VLLKVWLLPESESKCSLVELDPADTGCIRTDKKRWTISSPMPRQFAPSEASAEQESLDRNHFAIASLAESTRRPLLGDRRLVFVCLDN
jgi:hypothetical protein